MSQRTRIDESRKNDLLLMKKHSQHRYLSITMLQGETIAQFAFESFTNLYCFVVSLSAPMNTNLAVESLNRFRCKHLSSAFLLFCLLQACTSVVSTDPDLLAAIHWYTGEAGRVDDDRARQLLEQAAADGDPISVMWIARVYSTGRMTFPEDKARAIEIANSVIDEVERLAISSVAEANFLMGTAFAEGLGKPVDPVQAVTWYRRAAAMDNTLAQHNIGNVYASGTGVPQSDSEAVSWWLLAAEKGDAIPQFRLAEMYELGRGVAKDIEQALYWYRESMERGNSNSAAALDRLLSN